MVDTFTVAPNDRYKDTAAFTGPRGPEFALLVDPDELQVLHPDYVTHRVTADEVGMLDRVAAAYYGPGNEDLWWFIARANNMVDMEVDMVPGKVIVIPPRALILEFSSRRGRG